MRHFNTLLFALVVPAVFVFGFTSAALSQTVRVDNDRPYDIALQNVTVRDGKVYGQIVNTSPHPVRDVQLLVRRTWLWKNEFHPGPAADDPGTAAYITINRQIGHGESVPFSYNLPPYQTMPSKGEFMTQVSVAGFSEIIYPKG